MDGTKVFQSGIELHHFEQPEAVCHCVVLGAFFAMGFLELWLAMKMQFPVSNSDDISW